MWTQIPWKNSFAGSWFSIQSCWRNKYISLGTSTEDTFSPDPHRRLLSLCKVQENAWFLNSCFPLACFHCLVFQVPCVLLRISQLSVQEVTEQRLLPPLLLGFDSGLPFIVNFFFKWNIHLRHICSDSATAWSVSDDLGHCVCFNLFFYLFWELSIVPKCWFPGHQGLIAPAPSLSFRTFFHCSDDLVVSHLIFSFIALERLWHSNSFLNFI